MITNLADVLRILETEYTILSVKDTVKVRVLFEEVEVPLDLWTQAIMLHTTPLYEQEMRAQARMVNGITGEIA